jgi:hypothetical protein
MRSGQERDHMMESRVANLEKQMAVLQTTTEGLSHNVERMGQALESFGDNNAKVMNELTKLTSAKPFSIGESLKTILTTLGIFSVLITSFFWAVDIRIASQSEESKKVAELLMKDGDWFTMKSRVSRLEEALAWTATIKNPAQQR